MKDSTPFIVGIGGTASPTSSTEHGLQIALAAAEAAGARTALFGGAVLAKLPHYLTEESRISEEGHAIIEAVRAADGIILASPGYHGTVSGLVKNAIDYLEGTARDGRPYVDGLPVGLIATAYGWQAAGTTLTTLRSIVHALRGWPTPLGAAINSSGGVFLGGVCVDEKVARTLETVGAQVVEFAKLRCSSSPSRPGPARRAKG